MLRVGIAGASGYVGGELARLVAGHPELELVSVTSERHAGQYLHTLHPQLRGRVELRFVPLERLEAVDVLFLALPHGRAAERINDFAGMATFVIDCSADFRLDSAERYEAAYGAPHQAPEWLQRFVYGLPETNRDAISGARYVSGVGCNATAVNLALRPLVLAGLVDETTRLVADVKAGSSEGGRAAREAGLHAERSGVMRSYAPAGHRHGAEIAMVSGLTSLPLTVTAVGAVRGVLATVHVFPDRPLEERELWSLWREATANEPFLRVVHERRGHYRHPEPKTLLGTNHADLGWALDASNGRVVALAAIDNLMKGAAGSAVQCLNLMAGFSEASGLELPALWPV